MKDKEWIKDLKAGDKVYVVHDQYGSPPDWNKYGKYQCDVVKKITPKGFIRVGDNLYTVDGIQRTTGWHYNRIVKYTPELSQAITNERKRNNRFKKCKAFFESFQNAEYMSEKQCDAVIDIINDCIGKETNEEN